MFSRSAWALRSLSASVGGPVLGAHIRPLPSCGGGGQGPLGPVPLQPVSSIKLPGHVCPHAALPPRHALGEPHRLHLISHLFGPAERSGSAQDKSISQQHFPSGLTSISSCTPSWPPSTLTSPLKALFLSVPLISRSALESPGRHGQRASRWPCLRSPSLLRSSQPWFRVRPDLGLDGITQRPFLCPEIPPLPPTPDHSVTGVETVAS